MLGQIVCPREIVGDDGSTNGAGDVLAPYHTYGEIHVTRQVNRDLSQDPAWSIDHRVRATILVLGRRVRFLMGGSFSWRSSLGHATHGAARSLRLGSR